ncbi:MAG TPA: DUF4838 domain-containing protein [Planctomycetaceae bacterium]|nr:DUF4838 domain-containing protein [Planctomycetaceae bacterium]
MRVEESSIADGSVLSGTPLTELETMFGGRLALVVIWSLLCWVATGPGACAQEPFAISRSGRAECVIAVPDRAGDERLTLAGELADWLRRVTDADVPVQRADAKQLNRPAIVLAVADELPQLAARKRLAELGPEGFVVASRRQRLWLVGNNELAVQHAVFRLLHEVGCRWYFPDPVWTVVPQRPTLSVSLHARERPAFAYRRIWYGWGARTKKLADDYHAWLRHNRQLGHFRVDCGHAYERYIPRRLFKEHPDWFALVDGKRQPTQLCTSNPDVEQQVIEKVVDLFRREPDRSMASIEPNDGGGYCECTQCQRLGSVSDRVFFLANRVAEAVRAAFPDKWVGLYAYAYHADPPRFKIQPGVYVQVTTGFRYTKLSFDEQVEAFRRLGACVGVYDYFSVYPWDWDLPGAAKAGRPLELGRSIRHYHKLGLSTYDAESSCNWGPNGLGYWLAAQLMWDPTLKPEQLIDDFCTHALGRGAESMRRLLMRWGRGERFSRRNLKLALLDLRTAYDAEPSPEVHARLDRVAMYLHWLRLWTDYDRAARRNQWGKLARPADEVIDRARQVIVYSRRIMDTGLIHAFPMLRSSWFDRRFASLKKIDDFDWQTAERWRDERTDVPTADEVAKDFRGDLQNLAELRAVEIEGRRFTGELVRVAERDPAAVKAWGDVPRSPLFVESGVHYFAGRRGERLAVRYTPFGRGHTIKGHWTLRRAGSNEVVNEGDIEAPKEQPASVEVTLPEDGVYAFEPGTGYWRAAQVDFGDRPLSVWAGRSDRRRPKHVPLRLWLPRPNQPLYVYVPRGTKHFVIGIVSGGDPTTTIELRAADGTIVLKDTLLAGDQISVIVERDVAEYGDRSAMAAHTVLPAEQTSVSVPAGKDGQIWSLRLNSLRCVIELYDIPPFLARHPAELLLPAGAL